MTRTIRPTNKVVQLITQQRISAARKHRTSTIQTLSYKYRQHTSTISYGKFCGLYDI